MDHLENSIDRCENLRNNKNNELLKWNPYEKQDTLSNSKAKH